MARAQVPSPMGTRTALRPVGAQTPGNSALRPVPPPSSSSALLPAAVRDSGTAPASAAPPIPPVAKKQQYRLEIKTRAVRPGEKIVVVHSDFEITDKHAWIAFYEKASDRDQDYLSYTFLTSLDDRTYDVVAPKKFGDEYHFRLFITESYDGTARSERIQIK